MIKLNKSFYTEEAVQIVKEKFKTVAKIIVEEKEREYLIHIDGQGDEEVLKEFANHCLAESR